MKSFTNCYKVCIILYIFKHLHIKKSIHFDCVFTVIEVVFSWCLSTSRTQKRNCNEMDKWSKDKNKIKFLNERDRKYWKKWRIGNSKNNKAVFVIVTWYNIRVLSPVWLFATSWSVTYQAPLSMGLPRQEILEWVAISFSKKILKKFYLILYWSIAN